MRENMSIDFVAEAQASYLPGNINFWTLATVTVGSGFLFLVIITIFIIYRTDPDPILPIGHPPSVNYITPPSDSLSPLAQELSGSIAINMKECPAIANSYGELLKEKKDCSAEQVRYCCEGGTLTSMALLLD